MKNRFKNLLRTFKMVGSLIINKIKHKIQGYQKTEKGKLLSEYLSKVILEDYKPQTMTDYSYEEAFNPDNLEGEERRDRAMSIFLLLAEF